MSCTGEPSNERFVITTKWLLDRATVTGRYSAGLVRELDAHVDNGAANIYRIIGEIAALEGASPLSHLRQNPSAARSEASG
jgi:hypothetical protein